MLAVFLSLIARLLLRLRYRFDFKGLEAVRARGSQRILFLPNHPSLMDPVILRTFLDCGFAPHPLADRDNMQRPVVRWLVKPFDIIPVPDLLKYGPAARPEVEKAVDRCSDCLRRGENVLLYPAGRIYRARQEDLGGNSGVEKILRDVPEARVVLVRIRGLWGSRFGFGLTGGYPKLGRQLFRAALELLANGLFFMPRRPVSVEFVEPDDLPRTADRATLNRRLEAFYNAELPPNLYVPCGWWETGGPRVVADPKREAAAADLESVPAGTRALVLERLAGLTGRPAAQIADSARLAHDLGLDSLALVDLGIWLQKEFGYPVDDTSGWLAVSDVLLAACGCSAAAAGPGELKHVPRKWFRRAESAAALSLPPGGTITEVFLNQARLGPDRAVLADQAGGVRSYRDVITAVFVLRAEFMKLEGVHVGVMLPASPAAAITVLALLFAGKTPVMVNWTVGARNMKHSLELLGVRHVVTAKALLLRLQSQVDGLDALRERFVALEDLGGRVGKVRKLAAALRARSGLWGALRKARVPETAAVLFTSGSESLPKAVPLTHGNLLANLRDIAKVVRFLPSDRILGILPPFHSFGLTGTTLLPLCSGLPVVYHANPTEGGMLARLTAAYRTTVLVGTPTFLSGILRAATNEQLRTLRLVVSGAEKCPQALYDTLAVRCPQLKLLEGYGITECSPVISCNTPDDLRPGTIGRALPSVEWVVQELAGGGRAAPGVSGMLLVRGPGIFGGYLNYEGATPFMEFEGKSWYRTGDLVTASSDGVLTFAGRLKRFVKLGGEMISLPAVEELLAGGYAKETDEGPVVAVEATPQESNPELVLFTTLDLGRDEVNTRLRAAGLSAIHSIRRIIKLEKIPVLGTGKTDYRSLKEMLKDGAA